MPDVNNFDFWDTTVYDAQVGAFDVNNIDFIPTDIYDAGVGAFDVNNIDFISVFEVPTPLTYTASIVGGKIHVVFNRNVLDSIELRLPSSWTIGLPAGAGPLTITHVETVPNLGLTTDCYMTLTGEMVNGGAYTITLLEGAARAYPPNDCGQNEAVPAAFTGVGAAPTVTAFFPLSAITIRVQFSKTVRQVNPVNADDALNPANYVILDPSLSPLAVLSVASVAPNLVELTTAPQAQGVTYSWTVSNIKDIAGNVVA